MTLGLKRPLVLVLMAALALFCVGDLVHAGSIHESHNADHAGRLCGERGCEASALGSPVMVPAVIMSSLVTFVVAPSPAMPLRGDETTAASGARGSPNAPRSPPTV